MHFREMPASSRKEVELNDDWNQRKISLLEQKEVIESDLLKQVAEVLKVPVEAIKNFDEEAAFNIIANTFNSHEIQFQLATNQPSTLIHGKGDGII